MKDKKRNDGCGCFLNCETAPNEIGLPSGQLIFNPLSVIGGCGPADDCNFEVADENGCVSYYKKRITRDGLQRCTSIRAFGINEDGEFQCKTNTTCVNDSSSVPPVVYEELISYFNCNPWPDGVTPYDSEFAFPSSPTANKFSSDGGTTEQRTLARFYLGFVPTTCYFKVWFKEKITTYSETGICGGEWEEVSSVYLPAGTFEITPDMLANNIDPDESKYGYCLNNFEDFLSEENIPDNYITMFETELIAGMNESRTLAIWKWSFLPNYEPDDGSESYPFEPSTIEIVNGNGYPAANRSDPLPEEY